MIKFKSILDGGEALTKSAKIGSHIATYMQIDGEYYKLVNPDRIEIRLNPAFPRLKVLRFVDE